MPSLENADRSGARQCRMLKVKFQWNEESTCGTTGQKQRAVARGVSATRLQTTAPRRSREGIRIKRRINRGAASTGSTLIWQEASHEPQLQGRAETNADEGQ